MADDLTPDESRELEAIDRALSGRSVDPDLAEIAALASELQSGRAQPDPEYADRLDRQAAEWLAAADRPAKRGRTWLRIGLPTLAAGAAAVVIAVAVSGGGGERSDSTLALTAVPEKQRSSALAAPEAEQDGGARLGKELELASRRVRAGQPFVVRYELLSTVRAKIDLAGRSGEITLQPGTGTLEIGTSKVEPGEQNLSIVLAPGGSLHMRVVVES